MKKRILHYATIICCLLCLACGKDDENGCRDDDDNSFLGAWTMKECGGGFSKPGHFADGDIVFHFGDNGKVKIAIVKKPEKGVRLPFYENTETAYSYTDTQITIGSQAYDYTLKDASLTISYDVAADGPIYKFIRYR